MPKVSIVLTTLNGKTRGYLNKAIESVLSQTYKNFELIIIDDGSNDNTKEICEKYLNDNKVKYIYQQNKGLAGARNTGIKNSSGEYICFLDDDDIWKEEKLEKQINFFNQNTNDKIAMIYTNLELIDEKENIVGYQKHTAKGNIYQKLFYENIIDAPSSVIIKREVFDKVGLFKEWMKSCEDYELWFRIAKEYEIYSINEPLVRYRVHQNKMSTNHQKMEIYNLLTIYYALEKEENIDKNQVYFALYEKFFNKHFNIKNYQEVRKNFWIAFGYKFPTFKMWLKYILTFFPFLIDILRKMK